MTSSAPLPPPFPALRSALLLVAVTGVALLVAVAMLVGLGRWAHWPSASAAAGICLAAAVLALEPIRRASRVSVERVLVSALAAMGIRLVLSILGVALVIWLTPLPQRPTALWMVGWYLLLLAVEVVILTRYFRQLPKVEPSSPASPASSASSTSNDTAEK